MDPGNRGKSRNFTNLKITSSPGKSWRFTTVCSVIFGFLFSQGLLL